MRKTNRVIYFVEGECEAKLINALKEIPRRYTPRKSQNYQCHSEPDQRFSACSDTGRYNRCPCV